MFTLDIVRLQLVYIMSYMSTHAVRWNPAVVLHLNILILLFPYQRNCDVHVVKEKLAALSREGKFPG